MVPVKMIIFKEINKILFHILYFFQDDPGAPILVNGLLVGLFRTRKNSDYPIRFEKVNKHRKCFQNLSNDPLKYEYSHELKKMKNKIHIKYEFFTNGPNWWMEVDETNSSAQVHIIEFIIFMLILKRFWMENNIF